MGWGTTGIGCPHEAWEERPNWGPTIWIGCVHVTHSALEERPVLVKIVQVFKILKTYIIGMCLRAQHTCAVSVHLIFVHQRDHI